MREKEPRKETIGKEELFFLCHPGAEEIFSGYGLTTQPGRNDLLVGLLMVDRPRPADPEWLKRVENSFGEIQLVVMTAAGERGIACQMEIEQESLHHVRRFPSGKATAIQTALKPLLENPPKPAFTLYWEKEARLWHSEFASSTELPREIKEVFERVGYGCLAVETNIGVVHICHTADADIEGFADQPVLYQWRLIKMPTAPLIRLELTILDQPNKPFEFESFLNVTEEDQARVLAQLANQDQLYLAFYGDHLTHRFTKIVRQDRQQWQHLDELADEATRYWDQLPPNQRDFDQAKAEFMRRFA